MSSDTPTKELLEKRILTTKNSLSNAEQSFSEAVSRLISSAEWRDKIKRELKDYQDSYDLLFKGKE